MRTHRTVRHVGLVTALALTLFATQGCTYLKHRAQDAIDMVDIGLTVSIIPGFAAYADFASVAPGGFGYVNGWFLGWGGGQIGFTRHYERSLGILVWGYEEVGWGKFSTNNRQTLDRQFVGVAGIVLPPWKATPAYFPACVHYLHLGWLGVVGNARYMEIVDFVLGWSTLDIAGDDGYKLSKWPWNRRKRPEPGLVAARQ
jgi:hypothetical protein